MKKVLFFALILLAAVSCKKESDSNNPTDPTTDPRDAFVGTYDLHVDYTFQAQKTGNEVVDSLLSGSHSYYYDCVMTITKDASDDAKLVIKSKLYNCSALVSDNQLVLQSESASNKKFSFSGTPIVFNYTMEHGTTKLNDNVLVWHSDATGTGSVSAITVSGSASLDNTATKRAN